MFLNLKFDFKPFKFIKTGLPCSSNGKESACDAGDPGSIPGLGSSSRVGSGNPLQYSCLKNSMNRGAQQATIHGIAESGVTENRVQTELLRTAREYSPLREDSKHLNL